MNMKAIFFAGGGLMLSMVLTTAWISNDMQRIKEREAAKREAACAAMVGSAQPGGVLPAPADRATPHGTAPASGADCTSTDAGTGVGVGDPNAGLPGTAVQDAWPDAGAYPAQPQDAAPTAVDPAYADQGYVDPVAAGTAVADPAASPLPDSTVSAPTS